jgi:mucin-19
MTQALNLANFANNLNTSGATSNAGLQNSSVTVTAGTGMSGGGAVALGSSVTLTNAGVTSVTGAGTVSVSASTGSVTITGTGGSGTVTSVATGNGLSGGTITSTGTIVLACPSANTVGSYAWGYIFVSGTSGSLAFGSNYSAGGGNNQILACSLRTTSNCDGTVTQGPVPSNVLSGTWKCMGGGLSFSTGNGAISLFCRVS